MVAVAGAELAPFALTATTSTVYVPEPRGAIPDCVFACGTEPALVKVVPPLVFWGRGIAIP
jgi:hypothetical protein